MDPLIHARSCVVFGIGVRNLASIVTGWVTQRRKDRVHHTLRAPPSVKNSTRTSLRKHRGFMPMHS